MRTSEQEGADDTAVKRTNQMILNQMTNKTTIRTRRERLRTQRGVVDSYQGSEHNIGGGCGRSAAIPPSQYDCNAQHYPTPRFRGIASSDLHC